MHLRRSQGRQPWPFWAAFALPVVLFYGVLFCTASNIPLVDDYDEVLGFLDHVRSAPTASASLIAFLSAQSNEYKLFFQEGLIWASNVLFGPISFRALSIVGDLLLLPVIFLLWRLFLPGISPRARLFFFLPIPWILYQLQFVETLNWTLGSLQNIAVILFSLLTLLLLTSGARALPYALPALVLAIASSGNGLALIPLGLVRLFALRQWRLAGAWMLTSAACLVAYTFHYDPVVSGHRSVFARALHLHVSLFLPFLGAFVGLGSGSDSLELSLLFGIPLCVVLLWLCLSRPSRPLVHPGLRYIAAFILFTAVGVSGIRTGRSSPLQSRYTLYSALTVVLAWMLVAAFLARKPERRTAVALTLGVTLLCAGRALVEDVRGLRFLQTRDASLRQGLLLFQNSPPGAPQGPVTQLPDWSAYDIEQLNIRARANLQQAERLGIYYAPAPASADRP